MHKCTIGTVHSIIVTYSTILALIIQSEQSENQDVFNIQRQLKTFKTQEYIQECSFNVASIKIQQKIYYCYYYT